MKTIEQVLADAATLVERSWAQGGKKGVLSIQHGPWCAALALDVAATVDEQQEIRDVAWAWRLAAADRALLAEIGCPDGAKDDIWRWNDLPGMTATEVATTLRNAKSRITTPTKETD